MASFKDQLLQYAKSNNMQINSPKTMPEKAAAERPAHREDSGTAQKPKFLEYDEDYVKIAEGVMKKILQSVTPGGRQRNSTLTTTKIRNILTMVSDVYNDVVLVKEKELPPELVDRIRYMKVRLIYESGREPELKKFAEDSEIITALDYIGSSKESFLRYARYLEALVAYHKFLGGKD